MKGGEVCLICQGIATAIVTDSEGNKIETTMQGEGISFLTEKGKRYLVENFDDAELCPTPADLTGSFEENAVQLTWVGKAEKYAVYRAVNNDSAYQLLGYTDKTQFSDKDYSKKKKACLSYRITAMTNENTREGAAISVFLAPEMQD